MFFRLYLPPGSGRLRQPTTIDPTLDLCTRYPLRLGGPRQCGIRSLPNTSTHGQHWESNPRPYTPSQINEYFSTYTEISCCENMSSIWSPCSCYETCWSFIYFTCPFRLLQWPHLERKEIVKWVLVLFDNCFQKDHLVSWKTDHQIKHKAESQEVWSLRIRVGHLKHPYKTCNLPT